MNKFVKVSLILAGIFMILGISLCLVGGVAGGQKLVTWLAEFDNERKLGEEAVVLSADVKRLTVEVGAGELILQEKETDDGKIDISVTGVGNWDYSVENGKLSIIAFDEGLPAIKTGKLIVMLPKDCYFEEAEIEVGAGVVEFSHINAARVAAEIGAGEVIMREIEAEDFQAEVNAGSLMVENSNCINAELSVNMGECVYQGSISGNLDAVCGMGNMNLTLKGNETEHNYVLECEAGNIHIGNYDISGVFTEKVIDNEAAHNFEIQCGLGDITIEFE